MCSGSRKGRLAGGAEVDDTEVAGGEALFLCRGLSDGAFEGVRLKLDGRGVFLVFRYSPQALQIVVPVGDLRHKGVLVVPQLLLQDQ